MKVNYCFIGILLVCLAGGLTKAQVKEAYFHTDTFTISETVASLGNSIFLNKCKGGSYDFFLSRQKIIKLDQELEPLDSLDVNSALAIPADHYIYCPMIRVTGANEMTAIFNEQQHLTDSAGKPYYKSEMHVLAFDTALNVLNQFSFNSDSVYLRLTEVNIWNDSLYFTGFIQDSLFKNRRNVIIKTNRNGNWSETKVFDPDTFLGKQYFGALHFVPNHILMSLGAGFNGGDRIAIFDNDLNLIEAYSIYDTVNYDNVFSPASGFFVDVPNEPPVFMSSLAMHRPDLQPHYYFMMGVYQMDSGFHVTEIDSFPLSGNDYGYYLNPKPYFDAFDYEIADSVIMIIPGQEIDYINFPLRDTNDLYIYNYNAVTKQMNWMKVYSSGYSNSLRSAVEVLPGNRYLIVLNEYNWDKYGYPNTSVHLMILNSKGDIVGEEDHPFLHDPLTVYPMPFTDELRIEGLPESNGRYSYKFFEINGSEIGSGVLSKQGTVDTQNLRSGTFILQISDGKQFVRSIPVIRR